MGRSHFQGLGGRIWEGSYFRSSYKRSAGVGFLLKLLKFRIERHFRGIAGDALISANSLRQQKIQLHSVEERRGSSSVE